MNISQRSNTMPASPIRKLVPYAETAKKEGVHVYHLNIGQPDIHTPQVMMDAFRNHDIKVLEYGHSAGLWEYREALAKYYNRFDINVSKEDIIVTTGGSEAIIFAFMVTMDPGDEVIVPEPYYTNYNGFAIEAGVKIVPVTSKVEDGFKLPPAEEIEAKITDKTKAILLCNPNNPTGYVYTREEMETVKELVLKHDLWFLTDEVYREFVFDGMEHVSVLHLEGLEDRAIIMDSVSKRYSACGARIGCIVSKNQDVINSVLKLGQARLCPPTMEQLAGIAAVDTPQEYFDEVLEEYKRRRDVVFEELADMNDVVALKPKGAFYTVIKLPIDDANKFAIWLLSDFRLDNETVMLAPADGFYATPGKGKDEVRLAYVLNTESMRKAMRILKAALKEYPGRK